MPAKTLEAPARVPLYSPLATRTSDQPFTKDCRLYNGYVELEPTEKDYWIYKRIGIGPAIYTQAATPGLGLYTETGLNNVYTVFGNTLLWGGTSGPFATAGTVDASGPYFWETMASTSGPNTRFAVMGNGAAIYYHGVTPSVSGPRVVFQSVPLPSAYPTAHGFAYLNGLLYVMDTNGSIWNTLVADDITQGWAGTQIKANNESDLGVGIVKQLNYILALKQYSCQVFYDAGNSPGSPLALVPDSQMPFGCLAGTSIQSIDSTVLYVTSNETISPQIVQVDNLVPKIVSTPNVDRMLDEITWDTQKMDVRSWVLKHAGHRFYGLTMVKNNMTLVYDLDQLAWYIWTDPMRNFWPIVAMAYQVPAAGLPGIHIAQDISDGHVYQIDGDYEFPNDKGVVYPVDIYAPNFDAGIDRRKQINMLRIRADQTGGSMLQIRYSDDDYQSWSNYRTVNLGKKRPFLSNCGTFYRRAYHFRHQCNTTLRIKTVDIQMDIGSL